MAASLLLPTTSIPVNPPSELRQIAPPTTALEPVQTRTERRFIPPSSPTRQQPIVQHLRSFLEAATVNTESLPSKPSDHPLCALGMHTKDGVAKRLQWNALLSELDRAHAVTANTNPSMSSNATQQFLLDLSTSIANAVHDLLRDERCEHEDARTYVTDVLVWSHAQNARRAIVRDVVSPFLRVHKSEIHHHKCRFPVVILATEKAAFLEPNEASSGDTHTWARDVYHAQTQFLQHWRDAVADDADVLTIVGDNSRTIKASLEAVLEGDGRQCVSTPVLLVLYASVDSVITANLSDIRRICEVLNIKLCVEGPALAFLAQAARPTDPNECLRNADVLLTNPGAWFGFHDCAHVTIHLRPPSSFSMQRPHGTDRGIAPCMRNIQSEDQRREKAVAPVVRLWTMVSQISVPSIRERVDNATHISEAFMYHLRDCEGLVTTYEGVGCVVRLSYKLSRSEGINFEVRENEALSAINKSLYSYITDKARQIPIFLTIVHNVCVLQFSPLRLLNAGTFWMPKDADVKKLTNELKTRAGFYHLCQLGAIVFVERLATCADIELVTNDQLIEDALLWYGAFRVVPSECKHVWVQSSSGKHTVTTLTEMLVSALSNSFACMLMENPSLKELLQTCSALEKDLSSSAPTEKAPQHNDEPSFRRFMPWLSTKNRINTSTSSQENFIDLPFTFFIHFDDDNVKVPFISVEPKRNYPAQMAYSQACTAAEIVVVALRFVLKKWQRESSSVVFNMKPSHGLDDDEVTEIEPPTDEKTIAERAYVGSVSGNAGRRFSEDSSYVSAEEKDSGDDENSSLSSNRYLSALDTSEEGNTSYIPDRPHDFYESRHDTQPHEASGQEHNPSLIQEEVRTEGVTDDDIRKIDGDQQSTFGDALQMPTNTQNRTSLLGFLLTEDKDSTNGSKSGDSERTNESDKSGTDEGSGYRDSDGTNEETDSSYASTETYDDSDDEGYSGDDETDDDDDDEDTTSSESNEDEDDIHPRDSTNPDDNINPTLSRVSTESSDSKKDCPGQVSRNRAWLPTLFSYRWRWPSYFRSRPEQPNLQTHEYTVNHVNPHQKSTAQTPPRGRTTVRPSSTSATETDQSEGDTSNEGVDYASNEYSFTSAAETSNRQRSKTRKNHTSSSRGKPWRLWNREPITRSTSGTSNESSSCSSDRSSLNGEEVSRSTDSVTFGDSDDEYDSQIDGSASTIPSRSSYSLSGSTSDWDSDSEVHDSEIHDSENSETAQPKKTSWFSYFGYSPLQASDSDDDSEIPSTITKKRRMKRRPVRRNRE